MPGPNFVLGDAELIITILSEVFLPFELEYAYGAAVHLTMANAIFPSTSDLDRLVHIQQAHSILDEMIQKGNSVAEVRKAELVHLEWLFEQFATRVSQQDFQRRRLSASIEAIMDPAAINVAATEPDLVSMTTLSESQALISPFPDTPDNTEFLQSIGISSEDFLSIAEQMDSQSQDGFPYSTMDLGQFWK